MARNPSLLGWLFGGGGGPRRRKAGGTRKASPKRSAKRPAAPRKTPSIRTGRGPVGAATAKMARGRPKPPTARQRAERRQTELLRKFESGTISGPELREFLADARTARNPAAVSALRRRAERQSSVFHGKHVHDVVELSAGEQRTYGLPRFVVPLGKVDAIRYEPPAGSARAGNLWEHKSGDRGRGNPKSANKPLLVADPKTGRPVMLMNRSPMRFRATHGLVG